MIDSCVGSDKDMFNTIIESGKGQIGCLNDSLCIGEEKFCMDIFCFHCEVIFELEVWIVSKLVLKIFVCVAILLELLIFHDDFDVCSSLEELLKICDDLFIGDVVYLSLEIGGGLLE